MKSDATPAHPLLTLLIKIDASGTLVIMQPDCCCLFLSLCVCLSLNLQVFFLFFNNLYDDDILMTHDFKDIYIFPLVTVTCRAVLCHFSCCDTDDIL